MTLDNSYVGLIAWLREQVEAASDDKERCFWENVLKPLEAAQSNRRQKVLKVELEKIAGITAWSAYPDVAVYVVVYYAGKSYDAIGWATRGPRDKWDEKLGFKIAMSRALDKIVEKIVRQEKQANAA